MKYSEKILFSRALFSILQSISLFSNSVHIGDITYISNLDNWTSTSIVFILLLEPFLHWLLVELESSPDCLTVGDHLSSLLHHLVLPTPADHQPGRVAIGLLLGSVGSRPLSQFLLDEGLVLEPSENYTVVITIDRNVELYVEMSLDIRTFLVRKMIGDR